MKTIVYSYLFNYFGKEKYNGRAVTGAGVDLAVKCYRRDEEVKFDDEEPSVLVSIDGTEQKEYLCSVFDVLFDRKNAFKVVKNPNIDNLFRLSFGYDKIEFKVMGYFLDIVIGPTKDVQPQLAKLLPKEFWDLPVSESVEVSRGVFTAFLLSHTKDFDISDNKKAQCPSVSFID